MRLDHEIPFGLISDRSKLEQWTVCKIIDGVLIIHGEICYTHLLIIPHIPYYNGGLYYMRKMASDIDQLDTKHIRTENFYTKTHKITHQQATQEIHIPLPQEYQTYKIHIITPEAYNTNPKNQQDTEITQSSRRNIKQIHIPVPIPDGRAMVICNSEQFNYIYILWEK